VKIIIEDAAIQYLIKSQGYGTSKKVLEVDASYVEIVLADRKINLEELLIKVIDWIDILDFQIDLSPEFINHVNEFNRLKNKGSK